MKTKRIIFIVLGWLFIFLNVAGYLAAIGEGRPVFEDDSIPFIIGFNFWFLLGIVFFRMANKQKRKIQKAKEKEMLDNFLVEQS